MKNVFSTGRTLITALCAALAFASCERDTPPPPSTGTLHTNTAGEGFFILNEGGFNAGNSSISYYDMNGAHAGNTFNNLFLQANGVPLGDVGQSMYLMNGALYVVVNNSSKICVLNPTTLALNATITGFAGPRNMVQVDASTALVTQMYSDKIAILDLTTSTISGYIDLGVTSEAIYFDGVTYVTSLESDKLYELHNPASWTGIDSAVTIAPGGNSIVRDANGRTWILCYGSYATSTPGGLFRIDPTGSVVEAAMPMSTFDFATHLTTNPAGDSLFFLNYDIYGMSISDGALPTTPFISGSGHSFYTIGLMPNTSNFFAGDAVDYVQSGLIYRYDGTGAQTDVDTVGIIPNNFLWY